MRALDYAFRQAWTSLRRSGTSTVFAVLAIALAMVVLGSLLLVTWNGDQALAQWTSVAEFSVYLQDTATSEERGAVEALIDGSGVSAGRDYVSKADALSRFQREFTDLAGLTTGLDSNPFPASVEVRVHASAENDGRATAVVRQVAQLPGVADVRYDREWLARVGSGLQTVRVAGLTLAALMAIAAAVTVAAVVRLGLHIRRDEIEIMELVGAPVAFIRGPFVAEGFIQGGVGAVAALALVWVGFTAVTAWWSADVATLLGGGALRFLPWHFCVYLVAGGMAVGGIGGFVAARHAG